MQTTQCLVHYTVQALCSILTLLPPHSSSLTDSYIEHKCGKRMKREVEERAAWKAGDVRGRRGHGGGRGGRGRGGREGERTRVKGTPQIPST